jgi:uncharacterized protein YeaO (DUF488 family)
MIQLKRVYEAPSGGDGARFLVERLWPRGVRRQDLAMEAWQKEAGPSDALRKWFSHDAAKWDAFKKKYFAELNARAEAWAPIRDAAQRGPVTLLYSSHDGEHNNAVALKEYLEHKLAGRRTHATPAASRS